MSLSLEAQKIFDSLDEKTRKIIQKDYPFRKMRNEAIFELDKKGVSGISLVELSGLSKSAVSRIIEAGRNGKTRISFRERELFRLKQELDGVYKRYRRFILAGDGKKVKKGIEGRGERVKRN